MKSIDFPLNYRYSKEPVFVKKPRSFEAFEGDTVVIYCEVIGDPKPEVVWLRDFLKVQKYYFILFKMYSGVFHIDTAKTTSMHHESHSHLSHYSFIYSIF